MQCVGHWITLILCCPKMKTRDSGQELSCSKGNSLLCTHVPLLPALGDRTNENFSRAAEVELYGQSLWHFLCSYNFFLVCFLRNNLKKTDFLSVEVCSRFCFLKQEAMPFKKSFLWLKSWLPLCVSGSIPCFRGLTDMRIQHENCSLIIVCLIVLFFDENCSFSLSGDKCHLEITALWAIPTGLKGRLCF